MSFHLTQPIDFSRHNEEARRVWEAFRAGTPYRVPVSVYGSITGYLLNPELNVQGWSFREYFEDPEVQIGAQLEYQKWVRFNLLHDAEMGIPAAGWQIGVDFQNAYDAGWIGCALHYLDGQVPDTAPLLAERKETLYELPRPLAPTAGLMARAIEFHEYMCDAATRVEFEGRPVLAPTTMLGECTDGPFDLAYKIRGAENLLVDMLTDEPYFHDLMDYITTGLIARMKWFREQRWARLPDAPDRGVYRQPRFRFADDAIALISTAHYQRFVYPYHRRIFDEFSDGADAFVHLCGNATRHFKFISENLGVTEFDTGFPVDHGALRAELGPDIAIYGGPTIMLVKDGPPAAIAAEVKRICESGVMRGGRFVLIAANNLAPRTPVENVRALYEAARTYGTY